MQTIVFCHECGKQIKSSDKFCRACGSTQVPVQNGGLSSPSVPAPLISHFTKGQYFAMWSTILSAAFSFLFMVIFSWNLESNELLADQYVWASVILGVVVGCILAYNLLIFARKPFKKSRRINASVFSDDEKKRITRGAIACWLVAGLTGILAIISIFTGPFLVVTPVSLIDGVIFGLLGWGIYRYRVSASIAAIIFYLTEQIYNLMAAWQEMGGGSAPHYNFLIPLLVLFVLVQASIPLWKMRKFTVAESIQSAETIS